MVANITVLQCVFCVATFLVFITEIRRKQKPEFDKTSNIGPLNWKRLRLVKIPCGFVEQNGGMKKGRRCNSVENEVPLITVQIFAVRTTVWNESCITARMNLRSVTKTLPAWWRQRNRAPSFVWKKKTLVVHCTIKVRVYYLSFISSNLTSYFLKKNMINVTKRYLLNKTKS